MIRPAVFLCGSSGTGKGTIAKHVAQTYGLTLVASKITELAESMGGRLAIESDADLKDRFQFAVLKQAADAIRSAGAENKPFVTDRSIDVIAYTAEEGRVLWQMTESEDARSIIDWMRGAGGERDFPSVVFHVRPHKAVHAAALACDGGRRAKWLDWDRMQRDDGAIQYVLQSNRIPAIPITCGSIRDRVQMIDRIIELASRR